MVWRLVCNFLRGRLVGIICLLLDMACRAWESWDNMKMDAVCVVIVVMWCLSCITNSVSLLWCWGFVLNCHCLEISSQHMKVTFQGFRPDFNARAPRFIDDMVCASISESWQKLRIRCKTYVRGFPRAVLRMTILSRPTRFGHLAMIQAIMNRIYLLNHSVCCFLDVESVCGLVIFWTRSLNKLVNTFCCESVQPDPDRLSEASESGPSGKVPHVFRWNGGGTKVSCSPLHLSQSRLYIIVNYVILPRYLLLATFLAEERSFSVFFFLRHWVMPVIFSLSAKAHLARHCWFQ